MFVPPEWPIETWVPAFRSVYDLLQTRAKLEVRYSMDEILLQRDRSVHAVMDALMDLKTEGLFGDGVFLTIYSSDPSDHMKQLEDDVVQKLNCPEVVDARN